jgi:hypothetical protein
MAVSNLMTVEIVRTTCLPSSKTGRPPVKTRHAPRALLGGLEGVPLPD